MDATFLKAMQAPIKEAYRDDAAAYGLEYDVTALDHTTIPAYDGRTNLAHQVVDEVREHFPKETLDTLIPRSVRISEAPSYGQSVISYDLNSPGSLSYREAAAEIARRGAPKKEDN